MPLRSHLHAAVFVFAIGSMLSGAIGASATHGQTIPRLGFSANRFAGEVTALAGPVSQPTMFTLQLGVATTNFRIDPTKTMFIAKSAEAQVQGFVQGDYALITARRFKHGWLATRIRFDVQPMFPLRDMTVIVVRVPIDGMHLIVRPATGGHPFALRFARDTQFRVSGRITDVQPVFARGQGLQVLGLRQNGFWIGVDVDLRPGLLSLLGHGHGMHV
ncbi:MAG: hypothetical protein ACRDFX_09855 [Chloroflexota bacterium]